MKKFLSTALILGTLYGVANAAPATSPIFMPESGKFLSTINIGYKSSEFDKSPNFDNVGLRKEIKKAWNIGVNGKFGLNDMLSLNYGADFDFKRKILDEDASATFTNYYIGLTGRVADMGASKFDIILNIGQEEAPIFYDVKQPYVDLAVRYGLDIEYYNLAFSVGGKYINDYEFNDYETENKAKLERGLDFYLKLENEFTFDRFTIGLDMFYAMHNDTKSAHMIYDDEFKWDSYKEYGFNIDANYELMDGNYIGVYFNMSLSDLKNKTDLVDSDTGLTASGKWKDTTQYNGGIKYTTNF